MWLWGKGQRSPVFQDSEFLISDQRSTNNFQIAIFLDSCVSDGRLVDLIFKIRSLGHTIYIYILKGLENRSFSSRGGVVVVLSAPPCTMSTLYPVTYTVTTLASA